MNPMTDRTLPKPARGLVDHLLDAGWQMTLTWSDQGGALHVTIRGLDPADQARRAEATWHSRDTGTLRLFSCLVGAGIKCHDATLKAAMAYVSEES